MALDDAPEVLAEQREPSTEQPEDSLVDQWMVASMEVSLSHGAPSDCESQSGDSEEGESGSDIATHLKVATEAALARVTYDFVQSTIFPKSMIDPLGQSLCLILDWMGLSCLRISLLLGFACPTLGSFRHFA
jgi:hypothetical protein